MTKASIQAVAREAGVSVSTVSRTFAKPDLVLPETRDRVMTAAEKLDYSVSRSAAALKSGQSFRIALLASETITTWFNANIFAGLDSALRPSGYDTVPYPMRNAAERHDFFADLPVRRNADAVIVSSFDIEPAEVERLKHMHVPIVGINIPSTDGFDAGVTTLPPQNADKSTFACRCRPSGDRANAPEHSTRSWRKQRGIERRTERLPQHHRLLF